MTSDGKPPKTSPETLDDAFFSGDPNASSSQETKVVRSEDEEDDALADTHRASLPVHSSAEDEFPPSQDLASDFDEDAVLGRNRGLQVAGFLLVLIGAISGGLTAYYMLRRTMPEQAPAAVASASASAKVVAAPTSSTTVQVTMGSASASAKTAKAPTPASRPGKSGSSGETAASSEYGAEAATLAKGELSSGEISGVVERNRSLLKRRCWETALAAHDGMGPSARVNASFTVGPSGAVQSASASGSEAEYPGLASCIAGRIKEWKFPPSSGSTPVNVPFVFAAQ